MARKKSCEFCEDEQWWQEDGVNGHQLNVEVYPYNARIGITSFAYNEVGESTELMMELEMNYCPVCGRKLETL